MLGGSSIRDGERTEPKEFTRSELRFAAYAGLFDGEGCIGMYRNSKSPGAIRRYTITLRVAMTRRETLERMNAHFGTGTLRTYGHGPRQQPYWIWFCGAKSEVVRILKQLLPHLDLKAHEAKLALDYLENDALTAQQQDRIFDAMRRAKIRKGRRRRIS